MIERFFDDLDHRASESLAIEAERAERVGELERARDSYARAARAEESAAGRVPPSEPRVRTLLAISATSLWLKAGQLAEAVRTAGAFLASPDALTLDGRRELHAMVERARESSGVPTT